MAMATERIAIRLAIINIMMAILVIIVSRIHFGTVAIAALSTTSTAVTTSTTTRVYTDTRR